MAVVLVNSDLITDQRLDQNPPDPSRARGRLIVAQGTVANAASNSTLSMYHLCDLPADCIPDPLTRFDVTNWGYAGVRVGTKTNVTALINQTKATENIIDPFVMFDANFGLPLWQALGLSACPADNQISLYAHAVAGAVGAGSMNFYFAYMYR